MTEPQGSVGAVRLRCTRVPGAPSFGALLVEVRPKGLKDWQVVDIFSLDVWVDRQAARDEMIDLLNAYASTGWQVCGIPALGA